MSKKLCDLKKLFKKDFKQYVKNLNDPKFVCKSCGLAAHKKRLVCKPQKIKS